MTASTESKFADDSINVDSTGASPAPTASIAPIASVGDINGDGVDVKGDVGSVVDVIVGSVG